MPWNYFFYNEHKIEKTYLYECNFRSTEIKINYRKKFRSNFEKNSNFSVQFESLIFCYWLCVKEQTGIIITLKNYSF